MHKIKEYAIVALVTVGLLAIVLLMVLRIVGWPEIRVIVSTAAVLGFTYFMGYLSGAQAEQKRVNERERQMVERQG